MIGTVHQLSISPGGVPKLRVEAATIGELGLEGDGHNDGKNHGGAQRAVCLYALEVIETLQREGHNVQPGSTGDNVTLSGLDWERVVPGARLRLGEQVVLEITNYTTPCWKNAHWFADGDFNRMSQKTHPGASRVYARVVEPGSVRAGDSAELIEESAAVRAHRVQPPTVRWRAGGS